MYNSDYPSRADLPTSAQLRRSTLVALAISAVALTVAVLPAEYGLDPTGIGGLIGLSDMGRIKSQIASEGARIRSMEQQADQTASIPQRVDALSERSGRLEAIGPRPASPPPAEPVKTTADGAKRANPTVSVDQTALQGNKMTFNLIPGQIAEVKLIMRKGAKADYAWSASSILNCDRHGDAPGKSSMYDRGRGVSSDAGVMEAAFEGKHGWFWRNRGTKDVSVTVEANGEFSEMKRVM